MENNRYLISKEDYLTLKATWKKQNRSAWEHVVYNILRSKDPKNGFCLKTKNIQGDDPWYAYKKAKRWAMFYTYPSPPGLRPNTFNFKECFGIDIPPTLREIFNITEE